MSLIKLSTQLSKNTAIKLAETIHQNVTLDISLMGDLIISLHHQKKRPTRYKVTPLFNSRHEPTGTSIKTVCNETRGKARLISLNETFDLNQSNELETTLLKLTQQQSTGLKIDTDNNYDAIGIFYVKKKTALDS